jgi:ADP-ribose pyrophosphatase
MVLQIGVKLILHRSDGKVLLLKRSLSDSKRKNMSEKWDIPGGRINSSENLLNGLKREVEEETGITIKGSPKLLDAQDIFPTDDVHVVRLTYLLNTEDVNITLSEEHQDFGWFDPAEASVLSLDKYLFKVLGELK